MVRGRVGIPRKTDSRPRWVRQCSRVPTHSNPTPELAARRPLRSRDTRWARAVAAWLASTGIRPNTISMGSIVSAAVAGLAFWASGQPGWRSVAPWCLLVAAGGMQLRLLCNLFDGMVAVEGGFKTKSGEIFNELPDRIADALVLVGVAYSVPGDLGVERLGWLATVLAILTAYVRVLGASAGAGQHFEGPMAKQQRMAVLTITCVGMAVAGWLGHAPVWQPWVLSVIALGSLVTSARRVVAIVRQLEAGA